MKQSRADKNLYGVGSIIAWTVFIIEIFYAHTAWYWSDIFLAFTVFFACMYFLSEVED